jgi:DNA-binding IclR family transcriptional regulator
MSIQVIDRAVRILDVVSENGGARLSAIRQETALPISTVARILETLAGHALVERGADQRTYGLGRRFLTLSARIHHQAADLIKLGRPLLERLAAESGEDVALSRLQGTHAMIVDRVDGPNPLKIIDVLGQPEPLYCGAFRKVLLAYQSPEWIERYLGSVRFIRFTRNTITSKTALRAELARIREQGHARSVGERLPDAAGVAAPVFGVRGELEAAVFIVPPTSRFTRARVPVLVRLVMETARTLTALVQGERPGVRDHAAAGPEAPRSRRRGGR